MRSFQLNQTSLLAEKDNFNAESDKTQKLQSKIINTSSC